MLKNNVKKLECIKMYKKLDTYKTLSQWKTCIWNITCGYFKTTKAKNNFLNMKMI